VPARTAKRCDGGRLKIVYLRVCGPVLDEVGTCPRRSRGSLPAACVSWLGGDSRPDSSRGTKPRVIGGFSFWDIFYSRRGKLLADFIRCDPGLK
jgi:hypothetical protein